MQINCAFYIYFVVPNQSSPCRPTSCTSTSQMSISDTPSQTIRSQDSMAEPFNLAKELKSISYEIRQIKKTLISIQTKLDLEGYNNNTVQNCSLFKLPIKTNEELAEVLELLKEDSKKNELVRTFNVETLK